MYKAQSQLESLDSLAKLSQIEPWRAPGHKPESGKSPRKSVDNPHPLSVDASWSFRFPFIFLYAQKSGLTVLLVPIQTVSASLPVG